jgi:Acyclic terpene utilisation family protein AtuA
VVSGVRGSPPPATLKVGVNTLGGFRNSMTFVLCGLDVEEKAALARDQLEAAIGKDGLAWRLARTDHPDADTEEAASALLTVHIQDPDPKRAGRAFSQAAVELALASYPGFTLTTTPGDSSPFGVFRSEFIAQESVEHTAVLPDGSRVAIEPPPVTQEPTDRPSPPPSTVDHTSDQTSAVRTVPLGTVVGARSGDKGGDANLGVWARTEAGWHWLHGFLTVDRLKHLLPECAPLALERYELPNLRALNFVVKGILGAGVAASTRFDPQAKALGEWLRSRLVDIPEELL